MAAAIVGIAAAVIWLVVVVASPSTPPDSDAWRTVSQGGLSFDLPAAFGVETDADDAVAALADTDDPWAQQLTDTIAQFPDMFVLAAFDDNTDLPIPAGVLVTRFPGGAASAADVADVISAQLTGFGIQVDPPEIVTAGTGDYPAARIELVVPDLPEARSVTYVIEGAQHVIWSLGYVILDGEDTHTAFVQRSVASVTLD